MGGTWDSLKISWELGLLSQNLLGFWDWPKFANIRLGLGWDLRHWKPGFGL